MCSFRRCLLATSLFSTVMAGLALAEPFYSSQYGYSLDIPEGWVQVSKEVLDGAMGLVIAEDAKQKPIYDAAFQLDSASPLLLEYPYLMTQILPYAQFGLTRQIHERDFGKVVEAMTGLDVEEAIEENATDFAKGLVNQPKVGAVRLDREKRRYFWEISMELIPYGKIKGQMVGYFGRDSIVQLGFYAVEDEWSQHEAAATAMLDSFRFDPTKAYDETIPPESMWTRVFQGGGRGAIVGGLVGGLSGLVIAAFKRRKA